MPLLRMAMFSLIMASMAGCNSFSGDAFDTIKLAISGPESSISADRVHAIDAPVLVVEMGVAEALMVSNGSAYGLVEWHGVSEMLLSHHGRIVQTAGFSDDMIAPLIANDPFISGLHNVTDGQQLTRLVDYPALYHTGLQQHARYSVGKVQSIEFMGSSHQLLRIDESIHMPELSFRAINQYWVEPDNGHVRYSVQHIAPDLPPLRLTLVKTQETKQP